MPDLTQSSSGNGWTAEDFRMTSGTLTIASPDLWGLSCEGQVLLSGTAHVNITAAVCGIETSGTVEIQEQASLNIQSQGETNSGYAATAAIYAMGGVIVTGGTLVTGEGNAIGDIEGDLTVTAGTVTIHGTISGTTTHTGGTLNGITIGSPASTEATTTTPLRAYATPDGLTISGLVPGEPLTIYNIQGHRIYQSKAQTPEAHIPLQTHAIYILVTPHQTLKAVY